MNKEHLAMQLTKLRFAIKDLTEALTRQPPGQMRLMGERALALAKEELALLEALSKPTFAVGNRPEDGGGLNAANRMIFPHHDEATAQAEAETRALLDRIMRAV